MADQSSGSSNPQTSRDINKKRSGVLSWDKYFMATAFLTAKRSKDPVTQVGACIVNQENRIVSIGYNGMPNGDDEFPWSKEGQSKLDQKKYYGNMHQRKKLRLTSQKSTVGTRDLHLHENITKETEILWGKKITN